MMGLGHATPDDGHLRARIEAEVRQAERLRVDAAELARRIAAEARATEDVVRHIRWRRDRGDGRAADRD